MKFFSLVLGLVLASVAHADNLTFEVRGLYSPLTENAQNSIENLAVSDQPRLSQRRLDRIREEAGQRIAQSLRPFGYYHTRVVSSVSNESEGPRTLVFEVDKGPPVRIEEADIRVNGPGAELSGLQEWLREWPLTNGAVLKHSEWEKAKQDAMDLLEYRGYLNADYTVHRIELDLERNRAVLRLHLDTGVRAVMGEVRFRQGVVRPGLLDQLPRFEPGQPYDGWLVERLRYDLWKTGFYSTIDVVEERQLDRDPPVVNFDARLEERNRDTWQGSIGVGSDTEMRAQLNWNRHWLSDRGDSLGMGIGWQQRDNRYLFRTNYRLPRQSSLRSYWLAETLYREEQEDLLVSPQDDPDTVFNLTSGDIENYLFKGGVLNIRDLREGYQQISETWFVQYLRENVNFDRLMALQLPAGIPLPEGSRRLFSDDNSSVSIGVEWDWPVIQGRGFQTVGHHQEARLFTANKAWASDREFSQAYLSSRWNFLASPNIKILLRAEVGYSDADVDEFDLEVEDTIIPISLTELPTLYRFKAGGSQSVRGYSFESLSNNGVGSNNIVTFSAEAEWQFRQNWSAALFYDIGNAFNDWDDIDLKQGAGVGLRWYSIAGAVRLDFASGLDLPGDPWRIHFTLGVPLL